MYQRLYKTAFLQSSIQQKIQFAQQKLQETDVPSLLKFSSYLRICCAVMKQIKGSTTSREQVFCQSLSYLELMRSLTTHSATWWEHCYVNEMGLLQSDDAVLQVLLEPIEDFHYAAICATLKPTLIPRAFAQPQMQVAV